MNIFTPYINSCKLGRFNSYYTVLSSIKLNIPSQKIGNNISIQSGYNRADKLIKSI